MILCREFIVYEPLITLIDGVCCLRIAHYPNRWQSSVATYVEFAQSGSTQYWRIQLENFKYMLRCKSANLTIRFHVGKCISLKEARKQAGWSL